MAAQVVLNGIVVEHSIVDVEKNTSYCGLCRM